MRYHSNTTLYYSYKVFAFIYSLVFFIVGVLELYFTELTIKTILNAILLSGVSVFLFIGVYKLNKKFVQVVITKEYLLVLNSSLKISWQEIKSVRFRWYGLYSLRTHKEFYLFPPYDLGINILGLKVFTDEFDELINRKKKDFGI